MRTPTRSHNAPRDYGTRLSHHPDGSVQFQSWIDGSIYSLPPDDPSLEPVPFLACLVGGAVRDRYLELPLLERDYVVLHQTPESMIQRGFQPVGKGFPVFLHPQTHEEYALARTERKIHVGHQGFDFFADPSVTLVQDLQRRDLTINAMALLPDGTLIDPYHGLKDIQDHVLRHVSPAFAEDPLRVLRVARFAARFNALGFTIAPETLDLMQHLSHRGELASLSHERIWQECHKALQTNAPALFFKVLERAQALDTLFPEASRLNLQALEQAVPLTPDPILRYALLSASLTHPLLPHGIPLVFEEARVLFQKQYPVLITLPAHDLTACVRFLGQLDVFRRPLRFEQLAHMAQITHSVLPTDPLLKTTLDVLNTALHHLKKLKITLDPHSVDPPETQVLEQRTQFLRNIFKTSPESSGFATASLLECPVVNQTIKNKIYKQNLQTRNDT